MQATLFDAEESERRKEEGKAKAASPEYRKRLLEWARAVALEIASRQGMVTADDVVKWFWDHEQINLNETLGNGMGSLFRGTGLVFAGRFVKSARVQAHSNLLRVWEYPQ